MTDCKQLCTELINELEGWVAYGDEVDIANAHVLIDRARAALDEPASEPPTDDQLLTTYARALTEVVGDAPKPWPDDLVNRAQLAGLRAVLNRYGNPTP